MKRTQLWITVAALVVALSVLAYRMLDGAGDSTLDLFLPALVSVILLLLLRRNAMLRRAQRR